MMWDSPDFLSGRLAPPQIVQASLLPQHGESTTYVQQQRDHPSIKLTVKTYGGPLAPQGRNSRTERAYGWEPSGVIRGPLLQGMLPARQGTLPSHWALWPFLHATVDAPVLTSELRP